MAIDDLRGAKALSLDIGHDLSDRVGRRPIARGHHLKRLRVVDHRAEGLTELMGNRASQRRHRLAPAGVSSERVFFRLSSSALRRARRSHTSPTIRSDWRASTATALAATVFAP